MVLPVMGFQGLVGTGGRLVVYHVVVGCVLCGGLGSGGRVPAETHNLSFICYLTLLQLFRKFSYLLEECLYIIDL